MFKFKRALLIALIFSLFCMLGDIQVANSQGLMVTSKAVKGNIPADPRSPAWDKVEGITIPMSSQIIANPRAFALPKGKSSVRQVAVKSLNNGKEIAFLLEWDDMTENSIVDNTSTYRDAAALNFPVSDSEKDIPYFGMGHGGNDDPHTVNIWQWKADLEAGRDRVVPLGASYPGEGLKYSIDWYQGQIYNLPPKEKQRKGPVEDLNATGFGTLTLQDSQDIMGKGVWSGGKWRVIFYRPMVTKDKDDTQFKKGTTKHVAFAIWDGSNLEKDGQKSISTWHELKVE
ncbi:MAG: hypothetical protein HZB81_08230 [Deltaproteobacteria bacterium]|nr:hypothetical protein [Deltaproteobacteria bacterium]